MKQYVYESTWAEFGRYWAKIGREQTFWIFEEKCFFCFPSSINCFAILLKSERLFNIHETLADLWPDVNKSILEMCWTWKKFCKRKVETVAAKKILILDSRGHVQFQLSIDANCNQRFLTMKFVAEQSTYLEGKIDAKQMGLWI